MGRSATPLWLTMILLGGTTVLSHALPEWRAGAPVASLSSFPASIAGWQEQGQAAWAAPERPRTATEVLFRVYADANGSTVSLYLAYWRRQDPSEVTFTAKHAAPGAGWSFVKERSAPIALTSHEDLTVTQALYEHAGTRQCVSYLYVLPGRRTLGNRHWARLYMLRDYLTLSRSDALLVRVAKPVPP